MVIANCTIVNVTHELAVYLSQYMYNNRSVLIKFIAPIITEANIIGC